MKPILVNIPILFDPTIEEIKHSKSLYGNAFIKFSCGIKSNQNQNCPDPPTKYVRINDYKEIMLCERCYKNVRDGSYGNLSVELISEIEPNGA